MNITRPPLSSLACINPECELYGRPGKDNLGIRKTYGADSIRYLRCRCCTTEFSERKGSALWNVKVSEAKAISIAEQLAEGTSIKGTARLTQTHPQTVRRIALRSGRHAQAFHQSKAQKLKVRTLEMDERHGYVEDKTQQLWDAVSIDAMSKFIVQLEVGERTEVLFEALMRHSAGRLENPQDLLLMTDGAPLYRTLFGEIFGVPYLPPVKVPWDAHRSNAIASLAPWPMCKWLSIRPVVAWSRWRLSRLMAVGGALSKAWTNWVTTSPTPRQWSVSMQPLVA